MKAAILFTLLLTLSSGFAFAEPISTAIPSGEKTHYIDEQIMIVADISNNQDVPQNFAYLTQVKNDQDVVISLSWLAGSLSPGQSFSPAQSWTPTQTGTFHIQIFVWKSVDNPEALSPPLSMIVNVETKST